MAQESLNFDLMEQYNEDRQADRIFWTLNEMELTTEEKLDLMKRMVDYLELDLHNETRNES